MDEVRDFKTNLERRIGVLKNGDLTYHDRLFASGRPVSRKAFSRSSLRLQRDARVIEGQGYRSGHPIEKESPGTDRARQANL